MFALYIHVEIRKKKQTVLSSLQACFVITPSSGDFVAKNIRNHPLHTLHTLQICMICVAVVSILSSIVMQKLLITRLRMCYARKYHAKNSFEVKFCSTLLLAEVKMTKEKRDICPESLSR